MPNIQHKDLETDIKGELKNVSVDGIPNNRLHFKYIYLMYAMSVKSNLIY